MGIKVRKKSPIVQGFTIIEVMIVIAIASLIMLIVFIAVPELQRSTRDTQRKQYAREVLAALEDFQADNQGRQVNCFGGSSAEDCASAPGLASQFISHYMPDEDDSLTGQSYRSDSPESVSTPYCNGIATPSQSTVYCWNDRSGSYVSHQVTPDVGQVYIIPAHYCGSNTSDPDDAGAFGDQNIKDSSGSANGGNPFFSVVVMIGTENGEFYCINT